MLPKPDKCKGCPLEIEGQGYAPGEGSTSSSIILIGEALGEAEAATGRPFVGGTGQMLRSMLQQAGLHEREVYLTNTCKCRPPGNRVPTNAEIEFCTKAYLWDELISIKPNIIVPVGETALGAILPLAPRGITSVRGFMFDSSWGKILPIIHPSFVAHGNPEYWAITVADLIRVKEESSDRRIQRIKPNFNVNPSIDEIKRLTAYLIETGKPFSFDLETIGQRENINIMCIGFAWSDRDAMCIPFLRRGGYAHWANERDEELAWREVGNLLSSTTNTKITQNGFTFDLPILLELGLRVEPPVEDTLIKHHIVATELEHSLQFLTSIYTRIEYYKMNVRGAGGMLWAPDVVLRTYNLWDCVATFISNFEIEKEMEELGLK